KGHDVWLRCKTFDGVWSYHGGAQDVMMRSFGSRRKKDWFDITWTGYAKVQNRYDHWSRALRGGTTGTAFWWFIQVLNPDWEVSEAAKAGLAATKELREGVGQLLIDLHPKLDTSGIAIHYSHASVHASYARNVFSNWSSARKSWLNLLRRLGRQADFIAYEQIEKGELVYPRYKVLILPYSIAMSDAEIENIRKFVKSGGTVIGDLQTAATDTHCRERIPAGLDDVFGIKHLNNDQSPVTGEFTLNPPRSWKAGKQPVKIKLAEQSLITAGGTAMISGTKTPGFVRHSFGKGRAYYLNANIQFGMMLKDNTAGPLLDICEDILNEVGSGRPVAVTENGSTIIKRAEVFYYPAGKQHYLGIITSPDKENTEPVNLTVKLPEDFYAKEMIENKDYGKTRTLKISMPVSEARFFTLLSSKTTELAATLDNSVKQGETADLNFEVKSSDNDPGLRVVRITAADPNGKPVHRFENNFKTQDGKGKLKFDFALNDQVGEYTISLKEVATGLSRELKLNITPAKRLLPVYKLSKYPERKLPADKNLWQGEKGKHIGWSGKGIEESPLPLKDSLFTNPQMFKIGKNGNPEKWFINVRHLNKWFSREKANDFIKITRDPDILFRGEPVTKIEKIPSDKSSKLYWQITQNFYGDTLKKLAGKTIRIRFFVLRTEGPDKQREYDAVMRVRIQAGKGDSGYYQWPDGVNGGDAKAVCYKNIWVAADKKMTLPKEIHSMQAMLFGKFNDTLRFHGFMIEEVESK
ncbi:MAG: beta-galactosidase trimerization domain-containing protein, partial [Planctomycetota bacterium]